MLRTMRPFLVATALLWIGLIIVAFVFAQEGGHWLWTAALPAFLLETLFYLASLMERTRALFRNFVPTSLARATLLWASALLPYLVFTAAAHTFQPRAFLLLAGLCGVVSFWFAVFPRRAVYDAGFLIVAAAPVILRVFGRIYWAPSGQIHPLVRMDILGHLMWIRACLLALLVLRDWDPGPVSLWPQMREWRLGFSWFIAALLPLAIVTLVSKDMHVIAPVWSWRLLATAVGTFFGGLWVIALGEEVFFRGFIERALLDANSWAGNGSQPAFAVIISALLFGAVHLWFRQFPDYRRFATAAVLGIFCGLAYWQSRSVKTSMVTHACAIVTMRLFFR